MSLLITGVIDGPLSGGIPKAIELTATADISDLSIFALGSPNNGNPGGSIEFTFPAQPLAAGDTFYVATEQVGFSNYFGFPPDATGSVASLNGDDAVELFENGIVIDVFGAVGTDGSGEPWEYTNGWAYRADGSSATPVFDLADWNFSGVNALNGTSTNDSATSPFPAGTFQATGPAPVIIAAVNFDDDQSGLISGFDPATDSLDGGGGDFFGVGSLNEWPQSSGIPFGLTDDTVENLSGGGVSVTDDEGIFGQNRNRDDAFFALSDTREFGEDATATWTFDIAGFENLTLLIDMGGISDSSFGGFSDTTSVSFTATIDGGTEQVAFDLNAVDGGDFATRLMDNGIASGGGRVLEVTGDQDVIKLLAENQGQAENTYLDKATVESGVLDTFSTSISGVGATLTLTLNADLPFEALAFDNIFVVGTEADITGSLISISPLDAEKPEGDEGVTIFSFTVTRSGDVAGPASVDYAVSGPNVDASDFGGSLPSGTVNFAADQIEATIEISVRGDIETESDEAFDIVLSNPLGGEIISGSAAGLIQNDDLSITLISEIQGNEATWGEQFGRTDATPFFGATVQVSAVVVGDFQDGDADDTRNFGGFYLQEEDFDADGDATTSEGLFVFDRFADLPVDVNVGDQVIVTGTATEFFGETQISADSIEVVANDVPLPTAAEITFPIADIQVNGDGQKIADLEAYEGMLVTTQNDLTVGDLFTYARFGEVGLSAIGQIPTFTQENEPNVEGFNTFVDNAVRNTVTLDDGRSEQNPDILPYPDGMFGADDGLTSGDTVRDLLGIVRYSRGSGGSGDENYRINPIEAPTFFDTNPREETPPDVGGRLKVASFNVLNFFNGDGQGGGFPTARGADSAEEFARQKEKLVAAITALDADVLGLIEIENDGFDEFSAIQELVDALNAAGGSYAFVDPGTPGVGQDAIAVGFIYDTTTVSLKGAAAILDKTVDARFDSDNQRASLAQTFTEIETGASFTTVVNHLKSKGSPVEGTPGDEDIGDGAGNANATRTNAANALVDWLATDPTGQGDEDVLIIGDLNAYKMEDPIQAILDGSDDARGTSDDFALLTEDNTFGFPVSLSEAGQVQAFGALDYAIGNAGLASQVTGAAAWEINSVEPPLIDYNTEFKPDDPGLFAGDPFRSSDHDPIIVGLDLTVPEPETVLARLDFIEARGRDKVVYSEDGEALATDRLRYFERQIDFDEAGIKITPDDGIWGWEFITTAGKGIGVRSLFGDKFFRGFERKAVDEDEVLTFSLDDDFTLGDAIGADFEFGRVRGEGAVELSFFDDDTLVNTVVLDVENNAISFDLPDFATFDRVDLGMTGNLEVTVTAVQFNRLVEEDVFDFV